MGYLDFFWHLAGFVAPALVLGPAMLGAGWLLGLRPRRQLGWSGLLLVQWVLGLTVLAAGLGLSGADGRMETYGALVLCGVVAQWFLSQPR